MKMSSNPMQRLRALQLRPKAERAPADELLKGDILDRRLTVPGRGVHQLSLPVSLNARRPCQRAKCSAVNLWKCGKMIECVSTFGETLCHAVRLLEALGSVNLFGQIFFAAASVSEAPHRVDTLWPGFIPPCVPLGRPGSRR